MNNYLTLFDNNVAQARSLSTIYINLRDGVHIEDVYNNNLLKAQLVNVVSAFDMFIHGIVKKGVIEIFNKTRKETPKFQSFAFQAKTILKLIEVMSPGFMPLVISTRSPSLWPSMTSCLRYPSLSIWI